MSKGKSIVLLSIIGVIVAVLAFFAFVPFQVGVKKYNSFLGGAEQDYDLQGGYSYTLTLDKDNEENVEDISTVLNTLSKRMDILGYQNYKIEAIKSMEEGVENYSIVIKATETLNKYGEISSDILNSNISVVAAYGTIKFYGGTASDPTAEIMNEQKAVANCYYVGEYDGKYQVALTFTDYGYNTLISEIENAGTSGESSSYYLKITLGDTTLLNSTISSGSLSSKTVYISSESKTMANQMVLQIVSGGLQYKYKVSEAQTIDSYLGTNASLILYIAIGALILASMVFFAIKFKGYAIVSILSLLCFALIYVSMFVAFPWITLSAAGLAGVLLATIICVDGLSIIGKRILESEEKKTVKVAVKTAYKRSFKPILNAIVIAFASALLVFAFASGTIKSFAIALAVGIVISFISTVLISRAFMELILPLVSNKEKFLGLKGGIR